MFKKSIKLFNVYPYTGQLQTKQDLPDTQTKQDLPDAQTKQQTQDTQNMQDIQQTQDTQDVHPYSCDQCDKYCLSHQYLQIHMKTHNYEIECDNCGKSVSIINSFTS